MGRSGNFCPCLPCLKNKEAKPEAEPDKSSPHKSSHHKSRRTGRSRGNVSEHPGDHDYAEAAHHGATTSNTAASNDAGVAVLGMSSATAAHVSAMEGSACGSAHGGGGDGG